jgi:hypothetical protein
MAQAQAAAGHQGRTSGRGAGAVVLIISERQQHSQLEGPLPRCANTQGGNTVLTGHSLDTTVQASSLSNRAYQRQCHAAQQLRARRSWCVVVARPAQLGSSSAAALAL